MRRDSRPAHSFAPGDALLLAFRSWDTPLATRKGVLHATTDIANAAAVYVHTDACRLPGSRSPTSPYRISASWRMANGGIWRMCSPEKGAFLFSGGSTWAFTSIGKATRPQERLRGNSWEVFQRCRMVQPLQKPKRVKKFGLKRFNRHQCDRKIAVKVGCCYSLACTR